MIKIECIDHTIIKGAKKAEKYIIIKRIYSIVLANFHIVIIFVIIWGNIQDNTVITLCNIGYWFTCYHNFCFISFLY